MTFITHGFRVSVVSKVNFWDLVRNDNSNKGTTARLNETRFVPKKKSSPIYLGPKIFDTFWWNCQIIFKCASLHGRAGFILCFYCVQWSLHVTTIKLLLRDILTTKSASLIHSPFNYVSVIMNKSTNTINEHLELSPLVHIKYRYVNSWSTKKPN